MLPNFNLIEFATIIIPLLIAVTAHEYAHGYAAFKLGDTTAKDAGRLSLNPVRHLDVVGSFILPLILKLSGAPILFGYAKPVPVNFSNLRNFRSGTLWVASAGIITNFFLALVSVCVLQGIFYLQPLWQNTFILPLIAFLHKLFVYSVMINLVLAIFNLIPIPPLDGGRILTVLLPISIGKKFARIERFGFVLLILLLLTIHLIF